MRIPLNHKAGEPYRLNTIRIGQGTIVDFPADQSYQRCRQLHAGYDHRQIEPLFFIRARPSDQYQNGHQNDGGDPPYSMKAGVVGGVGAAQVDRGVASPWRAQRIANRPRAMMWCSN